MLARYAPRRLGLAYDMEGAGEHRLFSFITRNWRARPQVSFQVIVDLIASTTTETGLKVLCELDPTAYPKGVAVTDQQMASLNMTRGQFHGEWMNWTRILGPGT